MIKAPTKADSPGPTRRLTRDDWLCAGADLLADRGPDALKAEPLARHINTTKGSFYWHFKDVPDFHAQLLARWEVAASGPIEALAESGQSAAARLRALAQELAQAMADPATGRITGHIPEAAIRAWAAGNGAARAAVERVGAARHAALQALLRESGISNPEMTRIIHAAALGMAFRAETAPGDHRAAMGTLVDLILALR